MIINGTAGNDTLFGTSGADTINGFAGNDWITGDEGVDVAWMGAGDDVFFWHVGDGNDWLRGQDGFDSLVFECTGTLEGVTISANATARVLVSNTFGNTLDLDDIERIYVQALVGVDNITVNDLAGTDVKQVLVDLGSVPGVGKGGDGEVDTVVRNGGASSDIMNLALVSGNVSITGATAEVTIRNADAGDLLEIYGLGGDDTINASKLPANVMRLSVDGGSGNDTITGSQGNDLLLGDDGNDVVAGGLGNDFVDLGKGNDVFAWTWGGGKDTVNGGEGTDTLLITGSAGGNTLEFNASGGLASAGEITLDDVEQIKVHALAGADTIEIFDLTGADVSAIDIDLAATKSGTLPDAAVDIITLHPIGVMELAWSGSKIVAIGLPADVSIVHAGANDQLVISTGFFTNDVVDVSNLPAGKISLKIMTSGSDTVFGSNGNDQVIAAGANQSGDDVVYLGAGNDTFDAQFGDDVADMGSGNDFFDGGLGNDVAFLRSGNDTMNGGFGDDLGSLGAGNDIYNWRFGGNDTVRGGDGIDTFDYRDPSGPTVRDDFSIQAAAASAQFSRISGEVINLSDVERVRIFVGGGGDTITVNDLAGTGVKLLAIDLAGSVGSAVGDGEVDIVDVRGTASNDLVTLTTVTGGVSVTGLQAQVTLAHADKSDYLYVSGGDGNDTINASTMSDVLNPEFAGGNGNDIILGGACTDRIAGQDGNDTLSGGAQYDVLHGNTGNDRLSGGTSADELYGDSDNDYLDGGTGNDDLNGGSGNDVLIGGRGNDFITCGDGIDRVRYTSVLDGHDVILDFDGDPTGGQDVLDLDALFDSLGIAASKRAGLVNINDLGNTVEISVNADGKAGFELLVATLNTIDVIAKGQDVIVGT